MTVDPPEPRIAEDRIPLNTVLIERLLHWGKTDGVALRASLRTTAPLVGAGIDRIIHAHYVDTLSPLQLVARAKIALATVGTTNGPRCVEMLG